MKTLRGKGFRITEKANGKFKVCLVEKNGKTYEKDNLSFREAGAWVYEMADNNDIGAHVNHKMCEKFNGDFA